MNFIHFASFNKFHSCTNFLKKFVFILVVLLFMAICPHTLLAAIEAKTYISKKSIYDFQSLFLTIRLQGDYNSISSAGYLDETLLNDFDIKNVNVNTYSSLLEDGSVLYSRIMRYEIVPIRAGKSMIPAISILYDVGGADGYISTDAMAVRVYSKKSFAFHIFLVVIAVSIVVGVIVAIILAIRNARRNARETETSVASQ